MVITGASSGIGKHAALALVEQGYDVFATVRKAEHFERLLSPIKNATLRNKMHPILLTHISNVEEIEKVQQQISSFMKESKLPFVGIINNAGIYTPLPLEFTPLDWLHEMFDTNVYGESFHIQI